MYWDGEIEVDALGISRDTVVIGEAKWRNEKIGLKEIGKTIEKAERLTRVFGRRNYKIILLSKEGYKQEYEEDNIVFLDPIRMEKAFDSVRNYS